MKILETVALRRAFPERNLPMGLVGVIIDEWQPGIYEVEFADLEGHTYALTAVAEEDLLLLHHGLAEAA